MGRFGPGFSLKDQRKNRESQSSHRNGRRKITILMIGSKIPFVLDLWVSRLPQFGHLMFIFAQFLIASRRIAPKYKAPSSRITGAAGADR
jgi:hypothetical protein